MNFFASKIRQKSPAELVKIFRENSARLEAGHAANNNMEIKKVSDRYHLAIYTTKSKILIGYVSYDC
jgi:hypothetical protein